MGRLDGSYHLTRHSRHYSQLTRDQSLNYYLCHWAIETCMTQHSFTIGRRCRKSNKAVPIAKVIAEILPGQKWHLIVFHPLVHRVTSANSRLGGKVVTRRVDIWCWHSVLTLGCWHLLVCMFAVHLHLQHLLVFTRIINFLIVHYCRGNRGNEVGVARKLPSLLLTLQGLMSGVAVTLPHISLNVISCQLGSQLSHTLQ